MSRVLTWRGWQVLLAIVLAMLMFSSYYTVQAIAHHEPANKFAAAGAAIDDIDEGTAHVILSETMKVPSTHDLAIHATTECSILTYLRTAGSQDAGAEETDNAEGKVDMWVTIDGKIVPVQTGDINPDPEVDERDDGKVTFCNREYERYIGDREQDEDDEDEGEQGGDGIDEERDFIETKNANAFNWFALNVGTDYDDEALNGNNIITIELWAEYTRTENAECAPTTGLLGEGESAAPQDTCSDAYVGKRVLIAEPTNASLHENVEPVDTPSEPGDEEPPPPPSDCPPLPICPVAGKN